MTPEEYKALRKRIGTQKEVADRLGVDHMTISRRERDKHPIDGEAAIALRCLAEHGTA